MRLLPSPIPPGLSSPVPWRGLWSAGAFAQRDFISGDELVRRGERRGIRVHRFGGTLERWDEDGAISPVAFASGGSPPPVTPITEYESTMAFRDEQPFAPWSTYAWDAHGVPHVSCLYSPWQLLYLDDVVGDRQHEVAAELLAGSAEELVSVADSYRPLAAELLAHWRAIHAGWLPLMQLLVRIQNRYLPRITGRTMLLLDLTTGEQRDPWPDEVSSFDPAAVTAELGLDVDDVQAAYWFLVERGIKREPEDGLESVRRVQPRRAVARWKGAALRAQDNYDAAAMLRGLLVDLTGEARPPSGYPLDGRQEFRRHLHTDGPVTLAVRGAVQQALIDAGVYPHAVHVIGEGRSERAMVETLVAGLLGAGTAEELVFTDLGGSGSAPRLPTLVGGLNIYAQRTVLIVDTEGDMASYVTGLIRSGDIDKADVLQFDENLEDSNFSAAELVEVVCTVAASGLDGYPAVTLTITVEDLEAAHKQACRDKRDRPGRAGTLLKLAEDPAHGGPYRISKPRFAETLAERMLTEHEHAGTDDERERALSSRPLLRFVLERLMGPLTANR